MRSISGLFILIIVAWPVFSGTHDLYFEWDQVLENFVTEEGVHYAALRDNPKALYSFLDKVSCLPVEAYASFSTHEQMAFWINVYNAFALKLVVDQYPIENRFSWKTILYTHPSIQYIDDVWQKPVIKVFETELSLHNILNEKLKVFSDPRIHFALVCASKGAPHLLRESYRGETLDVQLKEQAKIFMTDLLKNYFDETSNTVYVSKIFNWFHEDFGHETGIKAMFKIYSDHEIAIDNASMEYLKYDWQLNDTSPESA